MSLAQIHSDAVDFPKTGVPAILPNRLRNRDYPHFMEKGAGKTYKSHKILGRLYDMVDRVSFCPIYDGKFDERILHAFPLNQLEEWFEFATTMKSKYDGAIRRIMLQHEIGSEIEVVTCFVLAHSPGKNDYKYHEEIGALFQNIRSIIKEDVEKHLQSKKAYELDAAKFAAASYHITWEGVKNWREKEGIKKADAGNSDVEQGPRIIEDGDEEEDGDLHEQAVLEIGKGIEEGVQEVDGRTVEKDAEHGKGAIEMEDEGAGFFFFYTSQLRDAQVSNKCFRYTKGGGDQSCKDPSCGGRR